MSANVFLKPNKSQTGFHVQKLAFEALQEIRIKHRWEAIGQENKEIDLCKELGRTFVPNRLENGDTMKQLLARSRYLLFKQENKWTPPQTLRAELLFKHYPDIEKAYKLCRELSGIYEKTKHKGVALTALARWYDKVEKAGFKAFNTIAKTIQHNYFTILNYFDKRSTNASARIIQCENKSL